MAQRYFLSISAAVLAIIISCASTAEAAPAFKFKKIFSSYDSQRYPASRADRRFTGGSSPIHFISPYMGVPAPVNTFSNFFAPQAPIGSPSSSNVYKLPLRLFNNGKPYAVYHGVPKPQNVIDYLPQAVSNIIRLPIKYISNAKPIGVYFKDPSFNFL